MAFTSGTATDYVDLLDKLRLYLVAQGWTQLQWAPGTVAGGGGNLVVRGPGAGVGKQVFVEIFTEVNVLEAFYCWRMRGMTNWVSGEGEGLHAGSMQKASYFLLWQNSINYWFYVNDRRFIVVAKMGTIYGSMHAGFFLPWATPDAYPFPLYIAGGRGAAQEYNYANNEYRFFVDPGGYVSTSTPYAGAQARAQDGAWIGFTNALPTNANDRPYSPGRTDAGFVHPYSFGQQYDTIGGNVRDCGGVQLLEYLVRSRQNEMPIWPVTLCCNIRPSLGVLDGVYAMAGTGLVSEQAITSGARTFRAFQNIHRSSGNDFVLIEEI